jgi:hypothetical protein
VYLAIGAALNAGMQITLHPAEPLMLLGASGVIYGLLAMCLVWAPRNDLQCIAFFRFFPMDFELPILWVAGLYIGLEFLGAALRGFRVSSALDHLLGAICGFIVATLLLKLKLVDCEGWDLFAVMQGRQGDRTARARKPKFASRKVASQFARSIKRKAKRKAKGSARKVTSIEDRSAVALRTMRLHLELGETEAALAVYHQSTRSIRGWQPPERDWRDLIQAVVEQKAWIEAASVMRDYTTRTLEPSPRVCLKLAQILIEKLGRPLQGQKILDQLPEEALPQSLWSARRHLAQQAEQMREDGELELQDEMW